MHTRRRSLWFAALVLTLALPVGSNAYGGAQPAHSSAGQQAAPANGRIAFATEGGHSQIYSVAPDGTDERQLTHVSGGVQVDMPDWSPDGTRIAYFSDASGSGDVWLMNADGSNQHVIAHSDGWDYYQPRWSPDGTQIAVVRCERQFDYCDLDVMAADGTSRHIVVGGHVHNGDPSWSPDGRRIAFSSDRAGLIVAVWVIDLQQHVLRRLTTPVLEGCAPSWSPSGTRILFTSDCDRPNPHVYVMRTDGSRARRLSSEPPNKSAGFASYSPDGRQIVFISDIQPGFGADVYTMRATGLNMAAIVTDHPRVFWTDWGPRVTGSIGR